MLPRELKIEPRKRLNMPDLSELIFPEATKVQKKVKRITDELFFSESAICCRQGEIYFIIDKIVVFSCHIKIIFANNVILL